MEITIGGYAIACYNQITVNLKYDSIDSTFSFVALFDPNNAVHRRVFKPLTYQKVQIYHLGVLILTGIALNHAFKDAGDPPVQLVQVSGYARTGVLLDSTIGSKFSSISGNVATQADLTSYLQINGLTLTQVANTISDTLGLPAPVIDAELLSLPSTDAFNVAYGTVNVDNDNDYTYGELLSTLCAQKNIVLSHTPGGALFLTRYKGGAKQTIFETEVFNGGSQSSLSSPDIQTRYINEVTTKEEVRKVLYNFETPGQWVTMDLQVDGKSIHSGIQVVTQVTSDSYNGNFEVNYYVPRGVDRYKRVIQSAGEDIDINPTARSVIGDELKNITVPIRVATWVLNGHLITPNQLVSIKNPNLHLYNANRWFIQEVTLYGDSETEYADITCVIPDCFGTDPITVNVFD